MKIGDKIKLIEMKNDPNPINPGQIGEITEIRLSGPSECHQINVLWEDGRTLSLLPYEDLFEIISILDN
jgi:hypothetical protein